MGTVLGIALMLPAVYVITLGVTLLVIHVAMRYGKATIGKQPEQVGWQDWMDDTQEWHIDGQTQGDQS